MPRLFRVLVPVKDIDQAEDFYSAVLGTSGERVSPGRHAFDCSGTELCCFDPQADGDGRIPKPNPEDIFIAVDDLDATHERCEAHGASFLKRVREGHSMGEIALRGSGERSFYVRDPFGNHLCFVDALTAGFDD